MLPDRQLAVSTAAEMPLWQELERGAADFLHAYWTDRDHGFVLPYGVQK